VESITLSNPVMPADHFASRFDRGLPACSVRGTSPKHRKEMRERKDRSDRWTFILDSLAAGQCGCNRFLRLPSSVFHAGELVSRTHCSLVTSTKLICGFNHQRSGPSPRAETAVFCSANSIGAERRVSSSLP
jgi:hypothetical protein